MRSGASRLFPCDVEFSLVAFGKAMLLVFDDRAYAVRITALVHPVIALGALFSRKTRRQARLKVDPEKQTEPDEAAEG